MAKTALIDTNILVYAYTDDDKVKQARANFVLRTMEQHNAGFLSVKTLSEFFNVMRRQKKAPDEIIKIMRFYTQTWIVYPLTTDIVLEAARGVRDHQFGYWDAQMWATAKLNKLDALFTEDMSSGSTIDGVTLLNPLDPTFDLPGWLS